MLWSGICFVNLLEVLLEPTISNKEETTLMNTSKENTTPISFLYLHHRSEQGQQIHIRQCGCGRAATPTPKQEINYWYQLFTIFVPMSNSMHPNTCRKPSCFFSSFALAPRSSNWLAPLLRNNPQYQWPVHYTKQTHANIPFVSAKCTRAYIYLTLFHGCCCERKEFGAYSLLQEHKQCCKASARK